jgi:hypothetical protein
VDHADWPGIASTDVEKQQQVTGLHQETRRGQSVCDSIQLQNEGMSGCRHATHMPAVQGQCPALVQSETPLKQGSRWERQNGRQTVLNMQCIHDCSGTIRC